MNAWTRLIMKLYRVLLAFYPSGFQAEFKEEMQAVFATVLTESQHPDGERTWRLLWREMRHWPGTVFQEHLRARRRMMSINGFIEEKPPQRAELFAAMTIFLLPLISIFTIANSSFSEWINYVLLVLFWGCIIFAIGLAISRGFPRWSLPYLGFVLILGLIIGGTDRFWGWIYPYFIQAFGSRYTWPLSIRITYVGLFGFIMMVSILLGALALVNLLRLLPYTRSVWQRIRADWTQLSFMLYGVLVFDVMLTFDEYRYEDAWKFMAWTCLAVGAWFYLRDKGQKRRILALIYGATGAKWVATLAKWILIPFQKWPDGYPIAPSETTRWVETGSELVGWVWILIMLLAPALLNFLPPTPGIIPSKEENPVNA